MLNSKIPGNSNQEKQKGARSTYPTHKLALSLDFIGL